MTTIDFFEKVLNQYTSKKPFVMYRNPNTSSVKAFLQENDEIYFDTDFKESGFVFSPFNSEDNTVIFPVECSEFLKTDYTSNDTNQNDFNDFLVPNSQKQEHLNLINKGIEAIKNQKISKVVLSRKETVKLKDANPVKIFNRLLDSYNLAFVYCWYHPKIGLWLGATPETLVKVQGRRFSTMALAGTQLFKDSIEVEWNEKEIQEQRIVTDFIKENLTDLGVPIKVSHAKTIKAGNLLHLESKIEGIINTEHSNISKIITALHPTPAVCGYPKSKAKQFILENENYNREYYTGFLGEQNMTERISRNSSRRNVENSAYASVKTVSNLYVNLRCMQIKDKTAILYCGGGITIDSIPENEWEETVQKTLTIKKVLC